MALQAPNAKAVGFKLFKEHVRCAGTRRLFSWLAGQYPDLHVIHIVRPNRLDAWVSRQLAKRSGVWETALPASKLIVNYTSCASYFYETPFAKFFVDAEFGTAPLESLPDGAWVTAANEPAELCWSGVPANLHERHIADRKHRD